MPGTKRTPIGRTPIPPITEAGIRLFEKMRRLRCTCLSLEDDTCPGCVRFRQLDGDLARELQLRPWEHPGVEDPTSSYAADAEPCHEAQARWQMLAQASRDRRLAQRKAPPETPADQPI